MCLNIQQLCPSWLPSPMPSTTFTSSPVIEAHHIDSRLGTPLGMGAGLWFSESCNISKGRWQISCPNHLLLLKSASEQTLLQGTSLKRHFICFLFPCKFSWPWDFSHGSSNWCRFQSHLYGHCVMWRLGGRNHRSHPVLVAGEFIFYGFWSDWFLWNTVGYLQIWRPF